MKDEMDKPEYGAINAVTKEVKWWLPHLEPRDRIVIAVTAVIGVLGTIAGIVLVLASQPVLGFSAVVFALLAVAAIILTTVSRSGWRGGPARSPNLISVPGSTAWERILPSRSPPSSKLKLIGERLASLRGRVHTSLADRDLSVPIRSIRANVFILDYENADGDIGDLFIPKHCRANMNGHTDEEITWRPPTSATGMTFMDGEVRITQKHPELGWVCQKESNFDRQEPQPLPENKRSNLHPDLQWIVTVPVNAKLSDGNALDTIAVLNVDFLTSAHLDATVLQETVLKDAVGESIQISAILIHCQCVKLALTWSNHEH